VTETFLDGRVRVRQPETGFRAGLDTVMLAAAVPARAGQSVLEPGAGAGTASLCLAARVPGLVITGIEIDSALVALANDNARANGKANVHFLEGDFFALPPALKREFDCVLLNPPFHGPGQSPPDAGRARALMDEGKLGDWLQAGLRRTVSGGVFTAILRADRVGETLAALPPTGITLFPLWPKTGEPARRIIVQAVKGSGAALVLSQGLVLHGADGGYTEAAEAVLRGGAALALN
jgi:tRNA1Val (adenine37-N6)-methyltransferase